MRKSPGGISTKVPVRCFANDIGNRESSCLLGGSTITTGCVSLMGGGPMWPSHTSYQTKRSLTWRGSGPSTVIGLQSRPAPPDTTLAVRSP